MFPCSARFVLHHTFCPHMREQSYEDELKKMHTAARRCTQFAVLSWTIPSSPFKSR
ncbi:hypothetical protein CONPUDRAFT_170440 [Coniophora puteana RWD-64-598 SS2]|uniref:Uncharacterized protein n=1 Tax=Coniophora puteana (strain RWD-64-598) TaxID=741705 RepID=R7SDE1_CONPW|nr:uncharacterized protein CONPUDRAFT_170440 [Coniophora puteana RWD-64-598 SS2]EIW73767.1 hypothetical protein CONPUDRAFT_170440 [Coniophora puteana RWD-64-598 SS2]